MKMAKKFLAVALAGVLALSVLTGCGDSASTKSIADAMSDMGKAAGITVTEKSELNSKAKTIAAELVKDEEEDTEALLATLDEDEGSSDEEEGAALKAKIMTIMGSAYNDQFVYIAVTETKGYNTTAQASNLFNGKAAINEPAGKTVGKTWYLGTTTVTFEGTNYRVAVITAAAEETKTPETNPSTPSDNTEDQN